MSKEKQIQDYERKKLIDEISKMPPMVIATAYLYALNYTLYGEDVTKAWTTAVQQHAVLSKARERGYYEALSHSNIGKDVLDKLRAEIEALNPVDYVSMSSYEGHRGASDMKDDVLQIIDKYKGEQE